VYNHTSFFYFVDFFYIKYNYILLYIKQHSKIYIYSSKYSTMLSIENDKNEYIILSYMNNTFKLHYKNNIWKEFTELYYDKMITLEKMFSMSSGKDLYKHVYNNNVLKFDNVDVYNDIKQIIKNNLEYQLNYWEKNIADQSTNKIDLTLNEIENRMTKLSPLVQSVCNYASYTPNIKLEDLVNYSNMVNDDIQETKNDECKYDNWVMDKLNEEINEEHEIQQQTKTIANIWKDLSSNTVIDGIIKEDIKEDTIEDSKEDNKKQLLYDVSFKLSNELVSNYIDKEIDTAVDEVEDTIINNIETYSVKEKIEQEKMNTDDQNIEYDNTDYTIINNMSIDL